MSMATLDTNLPDLTVATRAMASAEKASIDAAIARACEKIAPLWPLKHFVAVNPFLGFSGQSFATTCAASPASTC